MKNLASKMIVTTAVVLMFTAVTSLGSDAPQKTC